MQHPSPDLIQTLMSLPLLEAEWVLWLLLALSVLSVAIIVERLAFFTRHRAPLRKVQAQLEAFLEAKDLEGAADFLGRFDSLPTNTVLRGLLAHHKGPDAVEEILGSASAQEQLRYRRRLDFLATVGSNAPFIGLFGTVLGIIRAFADLSTDAANASGTVMAGISEALVATAVGLLVAIPAVIAYNAFTGHLKRAQEGASILAKSLLGELKADTEVA